MTRRDWWLVVGLALLVYLAFPRYEWRPVADAWGSPPRSDRPVLLRIDHWTGRVRVVFVEPAGTRP